MGNVLSGSSAAPQLPDEGVPSALARLGAVYFVVPLGGRGGGGGGDPPRPS